MEIKNYNIRETFFNAEIIGSALERKGATRGVRDKRSNHALM